MKERVLNLCVLHDCLALSEQCWMNLCVLRLPLFTGSYIPLHVTHHYRGCPMFESQSVWQTPETNSRSILIYRNLCIYIYIYTDAHTHKNIFCIAYCSSSITSGIVLTVCSIMSDSCFNSLDFRSSSLIRFEISSYLNKTTLSLS